MIQDCLAALRTFRRNPLLTATAILCLALGIGGTTAVFSILNGVLLRTLPYPNANRLVVLRTVNRENSGDRGRVSEAELRDWQAAAKSFESIAGYRWMTIDLVAPDRSERLQGLWVTPEFFPVFGIQPSVGHAFRADEPPGIILGRNLWERRFALDPSIIGRSMPVGICCPQQPRIVNFPVTGASDRDIPFPPTVPGIRDRGHGLNDVIDYWFPIYVNRATRPGPRNTEVVAKLNPGVTVTQAQSEMDSIAIDLEQRFPNTNRGWTIRVTPVADELFSNVRPALFLLMGAAAFVLLIACGNVAVLLTFNAVRRFHEIAVRAALGAGVGRLLRQFITESMLLTLCGAAGGLLVSIGVKRFLVRLAPANLPRLNQISLDGKVLGFALAVTILCGVVVGLIPALRVLRFDLESTLRAENSRSATSHSRAKTYEPMLVLQVALTLALLIGSGLMVKSLNRLLQVDAGFERRNVITTTLSLPSAKHAWAYNARFSESVAERVRGLSGVDTAGVIRGIPMSETPFDGRFWPWDQPVTDSSQARLIRIRVVSRGYFSAMGIPISGGRDFEPQDNVGEIGNNKVVIINQALARLFWPNQNAAGKKIVGGGPGLSNSPTDVVGVVGDVRYTSMDSAPIPEVYFPEGLFPQDEFALVIRTRSDPAPMISAISAAIHDVERDVFISPFQRMDEVVANSVADRRFTMLLLSVFSATGLLLAVAGIAGIVAYSLSLRVREVGIRVAMGAGPLDVIMLMSRQGLTPAFSGLALGILLALVISRFLTHMLYTVSPYDPAVFGSAVAALAVISVAAAGIPAYRACHVDASRILK